MLKRKLADWQNLLRLAASHALMLLPLAVWSGVVLNCCSAMLPSLGTQNVCFRLLDTLDTLG